MLVMRKEQPNNSFKPIPASWIATGVVRLRYYAVSPTAPLA
ncbi:MAG: hypothetical protein Q4G39_02670 [Brachymonas sp.]|nr:hypothetical protein [Brachymonas sp.]